MGRLLGNCVNEGFMLGIIDGIIDIEGDSDKLGRLDGIELSMQTQQAS